MILPERRAELERKLSNLSPDEPGRMLLLHYDAIDETEEIACDDVTSFVVEGLIDIDETGVWS